MTMASKSIVFFIFVLVLATSSAYVLSDDYYDYGNDSYFDHLTWPTEYYFKAELIDVKGAYIEPYEVWYSAELNKSRVDYYNGTFSEYFKRTKLNSRRYGISRIQVHYALEEDFDDIPTGHISKCFIERDSEQELTKLPDPEDFEYVGEKTLNGITYQLWQKQEEFLHESLTVYYDANASLYIPARHEYQSALESAGYINKHTITNFHIFNYDGINPEYVTYDDEKNCESMPESIFSMAFESSLKFLSPHNPKHVERAFQSYKNHHIKKYHSAEEGIRKEIFHKNWRRVIAHNSENLSYKMGLNEFSDRTPEELRSLTGTGPSNPEDHSTVPFPYSTKDLLRLRDELPKRYDLRIEGLLGPVRQQGTCGAGYAFAVTASVEGAYSKLLGGRNLDLSEQSLIDCSWGFGNEGCKSGQLAYTYKYILKHGLVKESDYGDYMRKEGFCHISGPNKTETFHIRGFTRVLPMNPTALKAAIVKYGPVAVDIHVSENFFSYKSGIFYDFKCKPSADVNHSVVVVGYGERNGTPYWIVRNSMGERFGLDGYILMSQTNNNCFVMSSPYFPVI